MLLTSGHLLRNMRLLVFIAVIAVISAGLPVCAQAADQEQGPETGFPLLTISIEGQFETPDREALTARLNEIRREACEEGVPNPETGDPLTEEDYVPMEWSYELEKIAAARAVEASVLRDHKRPDGTDCFSLLPDSSVYSMETLAWGYGSAMGAIEGWYSEKEAYVGETGTPAGHYIALIAPANRYAAIADLHTEGSGDSCAGAYGNVMTQEPGAERPGSEEPAAEPASGHWEIPLTEKLLTALINQNLYAVMRRLVIASGRYSQAMTRIALQ